MNENLIFKTRVGSHLFGTSTPSSDVDIKGVFIPSAREILKPKTQDHFSLSTGSDKTKNTSADVDEEYYALHKFLGMIGKGDMVATEMLFAPNELDNDLWNYIFQNRFRLLSRECKGFVGYVQRQANTYSVKGDRLNEVKEAINFLLSTHKNMLYEWEDSPCDSTIPSKLSDAKNFRFLATAFCMGKKHTYCELVMINGKEVFHFVCCDRKVPDTVTFKNALEIYQRVLDEYGNRAHMAAQSQGHDWKAISHAIRVGEEAVELLTTGHITFPRPNADYLLDIKLGNVQYSKIALEMDYLLNKVETSSEDSFLQKQTDHAFIEDLCIDIYRNAVLADKE